jgi:hypothetical protein
LTLFLVTRKPITTQKRLSFSSLQHLVCFQGRVVDTPEVARAKAAHLAAYNHAASTAPVAIIDDRSQIYKPPLYNGYHGTTDPLSHNGRMINTPEVAHAAQAHLADHANALHDHNGYYDDY